MVSFDDLLACIKSHVMRCLLVVTFGFLPQNFGRWWGPMNCHFAQQ